MTDFPQPPIYNIPINEVPNGQGFDDYRWSQLTEENRTLKAEVESLTHRVQTHSNIIATLLDRQNDATKRADAIHKRVLELEAVDHAGALTALNRRLTDLEDAGKPAAKPRDELNERVVAFLESHPDLKFTAISIDENIGGNGKDISDRLKTLAKNGRIRMFAEEKRRPFYQALEQPAPAADQPTS